MSTDFRHSQYDSLGEKLEVFARQGFRAWLNTLLTDRGSFDVEYKLQILNDILQKPEVSLPLVFAHLNSDHGNTLGHTRIPT